MPRTSYDRRGSRTAPGVDQDDTTFDPPRSTGSRDMDAAVLDSAEAVGRPRTVSVPEPQSQVIHTSIHKDVSSLRELDGQLSILDSILDDRSKRARLVDAGLPIGFLELDVLTVCTSLGTEQNEFASRLKKLSDLRLIETRKTVGRRGSTLAIAVDLERLLDWLQHVYEVLPKCEMRAGSDVHQPRTNARMINV